MAQLFLSFVLLLYSAAIIEGTPRLRRLAGGTDAEIGQFPYMAAIKYKNYLNCAGAIISSNKILTAASCVTCQNQPIEECVRSLTVQTGSANLSEGGNTYRVKGVNVADGYVYGKFASDIAVVTLELDIKFSANEKAVDLPDEDVSAKAIGTSSGWGIQSEGNGPSNTLASIQEKILPTDQCSEMLRRNDTCLAVDSNELCAIAADGNTKAGLCLGDSGNPLVLGGKVIGVSTWGLECGRGFPDMFANVYKYLTFIKSQL